MLGAEGANLSENIYYVFVFAKQHAGADFFTRHAASLTSPAPRWSRR
ncbi:hypothetical protein LT493_22290 [Streptomyces tricolor]|nr:hypothetical protein [Streptomyces tricolor]